MFLLTILTLTRVIISLALLSSSAALIASPSPLLETLDGQWHHLSEYIGHGKWTVLNVWGPRCPPCQEEAPELVLFHDEHQDSDATVVGVAIDFPSYRYANKSEVTEFVDNYLVSFPILLSDASITEELGAGRLQGLPSTYMYNPDGNLVGYQVGGITKSIIENFIRQYESQNNTQKYETK